MKGWAAAAFLVGLWGGQTASAAAIADGGGSAQTNPTTRLTVALCFAEDTLGAAVESAMGQRHAPDGWLRVHRGCDEPRPGFADPPTILLVGSVISAKDGAVWRNRVAMSPLRRRPIKINGRSFTPDTQVFHAEFPAIALDKNASAAPTQLVPSTSVFDVLDGLVAAFAYEAMIGDQNRQAAADEKQKEALASLRRWDESAGAPAAPDVSALVKQSRGLLLLDQRCDDNETATELLADAARLVPYRAETRMLAGLAKLGESYAPSTCVVATERMLLESLSLDPWSPDAVDRLGVFYELMMTAPPGTLQPAATVSREAAAARLQSTWAERAPRGPPAIEIGTGVSLGETSLGAPVRGLTPGVRGEITFGRDGTGLGLRVAVSVPWFRDLPLQPGWVSWARYTAAIGGRYRRHVGRFYGEAAASALAAYVLATGKEFDVNDSSNGTDVGAELAIRVGVRFARLAFWTGIVGDWWFGDRLGGGTALQINVDNLQSHAALPDSDIAALAGLSFFLWAGR